MDTNHYVMLVWEDYAQKLLMQIEQQTTNKQAGREGGSDPLKQSPLAVLKAGGWRALCGIPQPMQQQQPQGQEPMQRAA